MIQFLRSLPAMGEEREFAFPPPSRANKDGIVCAGGNLSPGVLLSAYKQGIFPWFGEGDPILWWSPDPRFVVLPETFHVSDTSRKLLKKSLFRLSFDTSFRKVMLYCAQIERPRQKGTWIVPEMIDAYTALHELGFAHSAEVWDQDELVGGLYGISLGHAFFGESMFSAVSGASRFAFLHLASILFERGFELIDSQVYTDYVASMGGVELPRNVYIRRLSKALESPHFKGSWNALSQ